MFGHSMFKVQYFGVRSKTSTRQDKTEVSSNYSLIINFKMSTSNIREFGKCMVFYGYDQLTKSPKLSIEEFVLPNKCSELSKGEVLLKLSLATVCGSDLHTLTGRRKEPVPW